jgi:hypothetical protein
MGLARFFVITVLVAVAVMVAGVLVRRRGSATARGFYARAVAPYAGLVVLLVLGTSLIER